MVQLRITKLRKSFGSAFSVNIDSLVIEGGEVVAIIGPNGAGKSTLVKMLAGVITADSGLVDIDGQSIPLGQPSVAVRSGIVLLAQNDDLFEHLSVADNVTIGREHASGWGPLRFLTVRGREKQAAQYLCDVNKSEIDPALPVHLLSGGQQKIVAIARALTAKPSVIIFDESINSLGLIEQSWLRSVYQQFAHQGLVVLVISHNLTEIRAVATRIIAMRNGTVAVDHSANQLSDEQLFAAMTGMSS